MVLIDLSHVRLKEFSFYHATSTYNPLLVNIRYILRHQFFYKVNYLLQFSSVYRCGSNFLICCLYLLHNTISNFLELSFFRSTRLDGKFSRISDKTMKSSLSLKIPETKIGHLHAEGTYLIPNYPVRKIITKLRKQFNKTI